MRFISTQLKTLFPKNNNLNYYDTYTKTNLIHEIHTQTIFR